MTVVDTSVWIEFLRGHEPEGAALRALLEAGRALSPECVFGELLSGARNADERSVIRGYAALLAVEDERGLWLEAGEASNAQRLLARGVGLIDATLLALAKRRDASLWTLDRKLRAILPAPLRFEP